MAFTYTGGSYTYIADTGVGGGYTGYPSNHVGGITTTAGDSVLANASGTNILAVVVTKVGSGTITIENAATVFAVTPTATGTISFGPLGLDMNIGFRVSVPASCTNNLLIIWKQNR